MTEQDQTKITRGEAEAIILEEGSDSIKHMLDEVAKTYFGRSIYDSGCVCCGSLEVRPHNFRDELSQREYRISKLCQECQDKIFGDEEE